MGYTYGNTDTQYQATGGFDNVGRWGNWFLGRGFHEKSGWYVKDTEPDAATHRPTVLRMLGVPVFDDAGQICSMTGARVPRMGATLSKGVYDQYAVANAYKIKIAYLGGQSLPKVGDSNTSIMLADVLDPRDREAGHTETMLDSLLRAGKQIMATPDGAMLTGGLFNPAEAFENKSPLRPSGYSFFLLCLATQIGAYEKVTPEAPKLVLVNIGESGFYSLREYLFTANENFGGYDTSSADVMTLLADPNLQAKRFINQDLAAVTAAPITFNKVREGSGAAARNKKIVQVFADQPYTLDQSAAKDLWLPDNKIFMTLTRRETFDVLFNLKTSDTRWYALLQACARLIPDLAQSAVNVQPAPQYTQPAQQYAQAPQAQYGQPAQAQQYAQAPQAPQYGQPAQAPQYAQAPQAQYGQAPQAQYGQAPQAQQYAQAPQAPQYGQPAQAQQYAQAPQAPQYGQPAQAPQNHGYGVPADQGAPQASHGAYGQAPQNTGAYAPAAPQGYNPAAAAQAYATGGANAPVTPAGYGNAQPAGQGGYIANTIANGQGLPEGTPPWDGVPPVTGAAPAGVDVTGGDQAMRDAEEFLRKNAGGGQ